MYMHDYYASTNATNVRERGHPFSSPVLDEFNGIEPLTPHIVHVYVTFCVIYYCTYYNLSH